MRVRSIVASKVQSSTKILLFGSRVKNLVGLSIQDRRYYQVVVGVKDASSSDNLFHGVAH
ncbi:hypothetical protein CSQ96_19395 [Janthinobacterium sp. BJB412]|nr:hypothetical protein CSQ96_19395 [Janthinobacterium sp. BJB412]